jgi:hypothetical protein
MALLHLRYDSAASRDQWRRERATGRMPDAPVLTTDTAVGSLLLIFRREAKKSWKFFE